MKTPRAKFLALTAGALLITILAGGCAGPKAGTNPADGLVIEATEFKFTPDRLELKLNKETTLTLHNKGGVLHDLTVKDLKVKIGEQVLDDLVIEADPGKSVQVTFTPLVAGEFTLLCDVPGHLDLGMEGTVVVGR